MLIILVSSSYYIDNTVPAAEIEISRLNLELSNEYVYYHLNNDLSRQIKDILRNRFKTLLNIDLSGFVNGWQYQVDSSIDLNQNELGVEQLIISNFLGRGVIEMGKKEWLWGEGFIFNATYPLPVEEYFWGLDYSSVFGTKNLNIGGVVYNPTNSFSTGHESELMYGSGGGQDKNSLGKERWLSWFRYGGIAENSNYTWTGTLDESKAVNFGLDYSRDLTMEISTYAAYNYSLTEGKSKFLVGGQYFLENMFFIVEYGYREEEVLLLSIGSSDLFSDFSWDFRELININDGSRRDSISFSYQFNEICEPALELFRHTGNGDSSFPSIPWDWGIEMSLKIDV